MLDRTRGFGKEFKDFIARGNVVDLAVAVIIGGAFGAIVTSLVDDILMPLIGSAMGGLNFAYLSVRVGDAQINYGNFIQATINFLVIAASVFLFVKLINGLKKKPAVEAVKDEVAINYAREQTKLLEEIRDQLAKPKK
jgi:large conductance mechanosensitive channel